MAAGGWRPTRLPIRGYCGCDVDDFVQRGVGVRGGIRIGEQRRGVGHGEAHFARRGFRGEIAQWFAAAVFRARKRNARVQRIGEYSDLTIEGIFRRWLLRQSDVLHAGSDDAARPCEQFGGLFRLDPWAAEVPSAGDVECDFEAELARDIERMKIQFRPCRAPELRPGGNVGVAVLLGAVGIDKQHTAVAFGLHLCKVAGDGLLSGMAVEPPPVAAQPSRWRRIFEATYQCVGRASVMSPWSCRTLSSRHTRR